jgi:hypothetical protein
VSAKILGTTAALVWLLAVGAGFVVVQNYQGASGASGRAPQQWPSNAAVALDPHRDTLLMFAHPRCPCTRASLEELNRLLAHSQGTAVVHVFFYKPASSSSDWTHTDLWNTAASLPGVSVREDVEGAQAQRFGAETSGDVLLFDPHGQLIFKGGITGSRGHAGDNTGESAILSLLLGQAPAVNSTPVYGCSLSGICQMPPTQPSQ